MSVFVSDEQLLKASIWLSKHRAHVQSSVDVTGEAYPPTDPTDADNPELWKPAHWAWFLAVGKGKF